jgi:integrase
VAELRIWLECSGITEGPLFRTRNGKVPAISNWGLGLRTVTSRTGTRNLSPYDLRRFHGTWLAESGVPYNEAACRMGHSLEVFMRVYVGTTSGVEAVANAAIERALG